MGALAASWCAAHLNQLATTLKAAHLWRSDWTGGVCLPGPRRGHLWKQVFGEWRLHGPRAPQGVPAPSVLDALKGSVVWITGASSGIGESLSYELARAGAKLALSGTNTERLRAVKDKCIAMAKDTQVILVPFDLSDFGCHEHQLKTVLSHYGRGYFSSLRLQGRMTGAVDVTVVFPGPVLTPIQGDVEKLKKRADFRMMSSERCAQLIAVAMANKVGEAWICDNPLLMTFYFCQYLPNIFQRKGYKRELFALGHISAAQALVH
ncbi:hypothetical protein HPB47_001779 [Ixodes persulcatus]|uniref:Uncharacterized protein n=1 Tax=Ixodes persulcatus TaxID=34615 RepID=A0AC60PPB3_IXOPE|nr:hypothetical protein HPB47_001779 [Ixodes persulcatus]